MNPNQCGTRRHLRSLDPNDAREIERFADWLATGGLHITRIRHLMETGAPLQLTAAPPYHVDDLVKIADPTDPDCGRWGVVVAVEDYRPMDYVFGPDGDRADFLILVTLKTTRGGQLVDDPRGPVPYEPVELAPLFGAAGGPGDWVRGGRVVSEQNWPRPRDGVTEAS
jgi:hypothetical protein